MHDGGQKFVFRSPLFSPPKSVKIILGRGGPPIWGMPKIKGVFFMGRLPLPDDVPPLLAHSEAE